MNNPIKDKRGVVLIITYFFVVALLGLTAVTFMRSIQEDRAANLGNNSARAFYEAESGLSFAYHELTNGVNWFTHVDKDTPEAAPPTVSYAQGLVGADGCYRVGGRNFQVKTFPDGANAVVILSQATVNGVTRTLEWRLSPDPTLVYQFLLFFPGSYTFDSDTYNGRNYGAIHVNGDILLRGSPTFAFLTWLSAGSSDPDQGFIKRPLSAQFPDLHGEIQLPDETFYIAEQLEEVMYQDIREHFYAEDAYFLTGDISSPTSITLPYYMQGSDADWEFDKYAGDGSDTTPAHFIIGNEDLYNLANRELTVGWGNYLLNRSGSETINIPDMGLVSGTENEIFLAMRGYTFPNQLTEDSAWNTFWNEWKGNHEGDATYIDGRNWERKYYYSVYDGWQDINIPWTSLWGSYGVNMEWWEDMNYGDDRSSLINDLAAAEDVDPQTGLGLDRYFLNTQEQANSWGAWLAANSLDQFGENQTRVYDESQGGQYLDPGPVIQKSLDLLEENSPDNAKNLAISEGLYIGRAETAAYQAWSACVDDCEGEAVCIAGCGLEPTRYQEIPAEEQAFLSQFITEKQFYNTANTANCYDGSCRYRPSRILEIDVNALKAAVEAERPDFNGVIYADLSTYPWVNYTTSYDENADGVMLAKGERLPDRGLSLVTESNIYIKGNYNLDPEGVPEKNRDADDPAVIQRVVNNQDHISSDADLSWQPAELITTRAVYTLSEYFPEPNYMPMANDRRAQYYEERDRIDQAIDPQDFVSGNASYPTNAWVPNVSGTRSRKEIVDQWFEYYYTGSVPSNWDASWISSNWPTGQTFTFTVAAEGTVSTTGWALQYNTGIDIESFYEGNYSYTAVHGSNPADPSNPDIPSQVNIVTDKHIYNTAIITPYNVEPDVLEDWDSGTAERIINGSFLRFPSEYAGQQLQQAIPRDDFTSWWGRQSDPTSSFNYESRYGRQADPNDLPNLQLSFGGSDTVLSWREINKGDF